jgi:hypothetical protein
VLLEWERCNAKRPNQWRISLSENIIAGLISGVLATLLVFVFRSIWRGLIIPWFEERIYKDVRIEGNWYSLYPTSSDSRQEVISIERHGHAITGTIICISGRDVGEKYQVAGSFRNMLLPLAYESGDLTKTDRGTITLKSVFNGNRLVGKLAFYNTTDDSIDTANIVWFRSKTDLERFIADREKNRKRIEELSEKAHHIEEELKVVEGVVERPADTAPNSEVIEAKAEAPNG